MCFTVMTARVINVEIIDDEENKPIQISTSSKEQIATSASRNVELPEDKNTTLHLSKLHLNKAPANGRHASKNNNCCKPMTDSFPIEKFNIGNEIRKPNLVSSQVKGLFTRSFSLRIRKPQLCGIPEYPSSKSITDSQVKIVAETPVSRVVKMEVIATGEYERKNHCREKAVVISHSSKNERSNHRKVRRSSSFSNTFPSPRIENEPTFAKLISDRRFSDGDLITASFISSKSSDDTNNNSMSFSKQNTTKKEEVVTAKLLVSKNSKPSGTEIQFQDEGKCWKIMNSSQEAPSLTILRELLYVEKSDKEQQLFISKCLEAVKNELVQLKHQDKLLMRQFVKLQGNISTLKMNIKEPTEDNNFETPRRRGQSFHSRSRQRFIADPQLSKRTSWWC